MKTVNVVYGAATSLVILNFCTGAFATLRHSPAALESFRALGYPPYFAPMLAWAQIAAVGALVAPVSRHLREWAYAGLTFDVVAAIVSLTLMRKPGVQIGLAALVLALVLASYASWRVRVSASTLR